MYECFHCGARAVYWNADFDFEDYGLEEEGIIHECTCGNCGAEITYYIRVGKERSGKMEIASFERREWIDPWNDRRPMTDEWVLITVIEDGKKTVIENKYEDGYGWLVDVETPVLGWMPLPEPMGGYQPLNAEKFSEEWTRQ